MREIALLLRPKLQGARNGFRKHGSTRSRSMFLGLLGAFFWGGAFAVTWRLLNYLQGTPMVGPALSKKGLEFILVVSLTVLIYSNVIVAISTYFLSRELDLIFGTPARLSSVFYGKLLETLFSSSWMIGIFLVPVLLAYGVVFSAPWYYYVGFPVGLALFFTIPAALAVALVMILVNAFPARKLRDLLVLVFIAALAGFVFWVRYLRPERLINPEVRQDVMDYVLALEQEGASWLPSTWAAELLGASLGFTGSGGGQLVLFAVLLVTTAGAFVVVSEWLARRLYFTGWSRTQEARRLELRRNLARLDKRLLARIGQLRVLRIIPAVTRWVLEGSSRIAARIIGHLIPGANRAVIEKDLLVFFRDTAQWSQLLLVGAITAIYILNIYAIRLAGGIDLFWMRSVISFLNIGMVGFVIAAICLRFVYPAVSLEGEAFWLLRSGPVRMGEVIWSKLLTYLPPLVVLALALSIVSNLLLDVHPFVFWLALGTVTILTISIGCMGVGLGAEYPDFRYENVSRVSVSYGGVLYMLLAMSYVGAVVVLEAIPAYLYLNAELDGTPMGRLERLVTAGALVLALLISVLVAWIPLRRGLRALSNPG